MLNPSRLGLPWGSSYPVSHGKNVILDYPVIEVMVMGDWSVKALITPLLRGRAENTVAGMKAASSRWIFLGS